MRTDYSRKSCGQEKKTGIRMREVFVWFLRHIICRTLLSRRGLVFCVSLLLIIGYWLQSRSDNPDVLLSPLSELEWADGHLDNNKNTVKPEFQRAIDIMRHGSAERNEAATVLVASLLRHSNNSHSKVSQRQSQSWELVDHNVAAYAMQGRRTSMEDRMFVLTNLSAPAGGGSSSMVYAIMDGHGGQFAVNYTEQVLRKRLETYVSETVQSFPSRGGVAPPFSSHLQLFREGLRTLILDLDTQLLRLLEQNTDVSGSTLLLAVGYLGHLIVANVGDSRGILCYQSGHVMPVSHDHKPNDPMERARIEKAGGFVINRGVWRVAGILAMSRALGDYRLKSPQHLVAADPDITTYPLYTPNTRLWGEGNREDHPPEDITDPPQFLILATDGLWDVFTNEQAVEFIRPRLGESLHGAKSLALEAYRRGSMDNISVMVVRLDRTTATTKTSTKHNQDLFDGG